MSVTLLAVLQMLLKVSFGQPSSWASLGPPVVEHQANLQWEHSMAMLHGQSLLVAGLLYIAPLFVKATGVVLFYYFLSHLHEILIAETSASFTTVHQPSSRSLTVSLMRCVSPPLEDCRKFACSFSYLTS